VRTRAVLALSLVLSVSPSALAADDGRKPAAAPVAQGPLAAAAVQWVRLLDDSDVDVRHAASVSLRNAHGSVLPVVEGAAKDAGPNAQAELKQILPVLRGRRNMELRGDKVSDWNLRTGLQQYDQFGKRDPDWDDSARAAIRAYVWADGDPEHSAASHARRLAAFEKARKDGCKDPLVNYFRAYARKDAGVGDQYVLRGELQMAAEELLHSNYPADRKLFGALTYLGDFLPYLRTTRPESKYGDNTLVSIDQALAQAIELFPDAARLGIADWVGWQAQRLMEFAERRTLIIPAGGPRPFDRRALFDKLYPAMEAALPGRPEPLTFKARFYIRYAWDARGDGFADSVTERGWRLFAERLDLAEEALTRAHELDPNDPAPPTEMISVMMGKGGGRERMELWFRRAMAANPDNLDACEKKLFYLQPQWHGSLVDLLAFGQECRRGENWRGQIPFILCQAYESVAQRAPDRAEYYAQDQVWADVRSVNETYLSMYPDQRLVRARFMKLAAEAGKWDDVQRHGDVLGDFPPGGVFSTDEYVQLRRRAVHETGKPGKSFDNVKPVGPALPF
jgi:tetratricopeptide (TPR) repeat protein